MRRPTRLLILLGLGAAGTLVSAAPARPAAQAVDVPPGIGIRLVEAPAERVDDPRARSYIIDHVQPGDSFTRRIEVSNGTDKPLRLGLYAAAATLQEGRFTIDPGRGQNTVSRWITVRPEALDLAPWTRAEAEVTVAVPHGAPDGERYAAVLAEHAGTEPTEAGVVLSSRVGIRVYLSVGDGSEPDVDFEVVSLLASRTADGRPQLRAIVRNTGGRAIDVSGEVSLANGPGGLAAGPFPVQVGTTIAPGGSERATVDLDRQLPAGPWDVRVVARSGETEREATARITFPAVGEPPRRAPAEEPPLRRRWVVIPAAIAVLGTAASGLLLAKARLGGRLWRGSRAP